jgi:hypothetical protein
VFVSKATKGRVQKFLGCGHINKRRRVSITFKHRLAREETYQGSRKTFKMSTYNLTIHDLLRITYTYEAQALEAQARTQQTQRPRSDSACSVRFSFFVSLRKTGVLMTSRCQKQVRTSHHPRLHPQRMRCWKRTSRTSTAGGVGAHKALDEVRNGR